MTSRPLDEPPTVPSFDRPTLRLLSLGLGGPTRPVARLLTRLADDDGARWFESALTRLPLDEKSARAFFFDSLPSTKRLESLKDRSKRLAHCDEEDTLVGTLGYLLAVAWAADLHRARISTRPAAELAGALLDLAQALGPPWEPALARAALFIESAPVG